MITSGSLCTGYDGLGRALSLLKPHRPLWHAEVDADMSHVLKIHDPHTRNVGDLTTAPWHLAPTPDVVTAGIPCQPISVAGRGDGEDDERYLWPDAVRCFREVRPPFLFLENVERLVSMKLRSGAPMLQQWLSDLRDLGYAVTWTVIGACAVGAPHHRHRFYAWAAYTGTTSPTPGAVRLRTRCGAPRNGGHFLLPTPVARDGDDRGNGDADYWRKRRDAGRSNGLPLDAVATLLPSPRASDAGRYGTEQQRALRTKTGGTLQDAVGTLPAVPLLPTPTASSYGNNQGGAAGRVGPVRHSIETIASDPNLWGRYAEAVALWEQITGVPAPLPTEPNSKGGRRMSPLLPEWMMGLPPGTLTDHLSRNAAIKGAGNGVVPLQAAAAQKLLAG